MARIKTTSERDARGIQRALVWYTKRQYGYLPGIFQILLPDFGLARHVGAIYNRLHLGKRSQLSRVQREMLAVVVNGHVHGAP